jgi:hypothetical protein
MTAMLKETYDAQGPTPTDARMRANAKCDSWIDLQRKAGRQIVDEGRGSVTTRTGPESFECEVTLMYHELVPMAREQDRASA